MVKNIVPTYVQQRFKFQMQKSQHYSLLDQDSDKYLLSQTSSHKASRIWSVCHADGKLTYKVSLQNTEQSYLRCSCGFSTISGLPCSHEFWLQNYLHHHQKTSKSLLKFRYRWLQTYEEENRGKLHRAEDGLMFIHKQLNYLMPDLRTHAKSTNADAP